MTHALGGIERKDKMGNKNYHNFSQHSDKKENNVVSEEMLNPLAAEAETTVEEVFETVIDEVIKENVEDTTVEEAELTEGFVIGCSKLNVRAKADKDSEVLCVIESDAEVIVNLDETTMDFFKVCTSAGVEGYCMKKYIAVK